MVYAFKVINLVKRYGERLAVDNLSFTVEKGQIYGFLGVNGAGKTTTLRIIAGVLQPTKGEVFISGIDLLKEPEKAKAITGYIPDRPYIYPKLTAYEFLTFIGKVYRLPINELKDRIDSLLKEYGLYGVKDNLIDSYSHGMKQRLTTCAALLHKPEVLIIDEPMVGLDPHGAKILKTNLRRYASEGIGIILSTHTLSVAEEISDKIGIINQGKLLAEGTVDQIKQLSNNPDSYTLEQVFIDLTKSSTELIEID